MPAAVYASAGAGRSAPSSIKAGGHAPPPHRRIGAGAKRNRGTVDFYRGNLRLSSATVVARRWPPLVPPGQRPGCREAAELSARYSGDATDAPGAQLASAAVCAASGRFRSRWGITASRSNAASKLHHLLTLSASVRGHQRRGEVAAFVVRRYSACSAPFASVQRR